MAPEGVVRAVPLHLSVDPLHQDELRDERPVGLETKAVTLAVRALRAEVAVERQPRGGWAEIGRVRAMRVWARCVDTRCRGQLGGWA